LISVPSLLISSCFSFRSLSSLDFLLPLVFDFDLFRHPAWLMPFASRSGSLSVSFSVSVSPAVSLLSAFCVSCFINSCMLSLYVIWAFVDVTPPPPPHHPLPHPHTTHTTNKHTLKQTNKPHKPNSQPKMKHHPAKNRK
jgi:hypothetical protein